MSNFSRYIDSIIAHVPDTFKNQYGFQCVKSACEIASHLGYPVNPHNNAWNIYLKGAPGYTKKVPGSYIPLPGDLIFMSPAPINGKAGHIAVSDIGSTMNQYNVIHQNYGVHGVSGSGIGDRHLKRQTILAQQWAGILARNNPFIITP